MKYDIVVVGGGLAGLTAAYFTAKEGRKTLLLERSEKFGGRARTIHHQGYLTNFGPHALAIEGPAYQTLHQIGCALSGGKPRPSRMAFMESQKLRHPLAYLGTQGLWEFLSHYLRLPEPTGGDWMSWLQSVVKSPRLRAVLITMARVSTYTYDLDTADAISVERQLRGALTKGVLYLDGGWQTLVDKLRSECVKLGVETRPGTSALAVEPGMVHLKAESLHTHAVILAVDPTSVRRLTGLPLVATKPSRASVLELSLARTLEGPEIVFDVNRPLYLSIHSAVARLSPPKTSRVSVMRYLADGDSGRRDELEDYMELCHPGWRSCVRECRFFPNLTVSHDVHEAGRERNVVKTSLENVYLAGDWIGDGWLADASISSARLAAGLALNSFKSLVRS